MNRLSFRKLFSFLLIISLILTVFTAQAYAGVYSSYTGTKTHTLDTSYAVAQPNSGYWPTLNAAGAKLKGVNDHRIGGAYAFCVDPDKSTATNLQYVYTPVSALSSTEADLETALNYAMRYKQLMSGNLEMTMTHENEMANNYPAQIYPYFHAATQLAIYESDEQVSNYVTSRPPYQTISEFMFHNAGYPNEYLYEWTQDVENFVDDNYVDLNVEYKTLSKLGAIKNVDLEYNPSSNTFEASVNAGAQAQYYDWGSQPYASLSGTTVNFSVPAEDIVEVVDDWQQMDDTKFTYSNTVSGEITNTTVPDYSVFQSSSGSNQRVITYNNKNGKTVTIKSPQTSDYTLNAEVDKGRDYGAPGGGGGYAGGKVSDTDSVAGGGSNFIAGSGSNQIMYDGNAGGKPAVPDGSNDGYARITLIQVE